MRPDDGGRARRVYFDHNSTTPLHPEVREAMASFLGASFGNPSSIHGYGREARKAVEWAREEVAALIGAADVEEVVFTSGGTESDNMALRGVLAHFGFRVHLVTSQVEHP
ncbi:MAG: aminotransferase class V-fold PLP-dependent enzyme, partial [Nitrospinota bacterium]